MEISASTTMSDQVNEENDSGGVGTESPLPALERLVACPHCRGAGETMGIACGTSCDYRSMQCFTCGGTGKVSEAHIERMRVAEIIRQDRIARRLTIRDEGSRLKVDFAEWSRIEAGREPETEAGQRALAMRYQELNMPEREAETQNVR